MVLSSLTCPSCRSPLPPTDAHLPSDGPVHCPVCGTRVTPVPTGQTTVSHEASPGQQTVPYQGTAGGHGSEAGGLAAPPGYEILDLLGVGGMGAVYRARQLGLKRVVALKVIRRGSENEAMRSRFRTEAEAAARLQHPNVVQVFEVVEHQGELYCVQEYVPGGSLDRRLAGNPLPAAVAARLVESLASAMAHAHQMQLIHRDLKPANILLRPRTEHAENQPAAVADCDAKVGDFGLAKLLDPDAPGLTQHNAVLGSPSYMAPEQALAQDVGPAADIYALGAILYECLTGRPPFKAATVWETLDLVRTAEPVPPRQLQPGVPRDLETICLQCLRKDPKRRYASSQDLADDLARFARGEPVLARAIGTAERTVRWVKRRPLVAGLLALLTLTVAAFSGVLLERNTELSRTNTDLAGANRALEEDEKQLEKKNQELQEETTRAKASETKALTAEGRAQKAAAEATEQRDVARRGMFAATLANVALLADKDPDEGLVLLEDGKRCPPPLRDFTWKLLHAACQRGRFTIRLSSSQDVARSHARGRMASAEVAFPAPEVLVSLLRGDKEIRVRRFQLSSGLLLGEQTLPAWAAFDAERRIAAVLTPAGKLERFDLANGREIASWQLDGLHLPPKPALVGETSPMAHVVFTFSADLRRLAVLDADHKVLVYDTRSGKLRHRLALPAEKAATDAPVPLRLRFTPSGERLLCVVRTRPGSPAGFQKAASAAVGATHVWDTASGRHLHRLSKSGRIAEVEELSPDGRWLVGWVPFNGNEPSDLELFNLDSGQAVDVTRYAGVAVRLLRFAPAVGPTRQLVFIGRNGGLVAGDAGESNGISFWDLAGDTPRALGSGAAFDARGILSPDGKTLAVGTSDGLRIYDVASGQLLLGSQAQLARPEDVRNRSQLDKQKPVGFTPDGKRLVTPGLKIWDLASRRELLTLPGNGPIFFSPDGRTLAVSTGANGFTLYDADTEPVLGRPLPWNEPVESVSLTPDGRTLAMLGGELRGFPTGLIPRLLLFDLTTARQRAVLFSSDAVTDVRTAAFMPDGSALALDMAGTLQLYDRTGRMARRVPLAPRQPGRLAGFPILMPDGAASVPRFPYVLTRDGRHALLTRSATQLELRDLDTNKTVETLDAPAAISCRPVMSADSNRVVAGLGDGRVIVWDRAARSHRLSPGRHAGDVSAVTIDAGGERVASLGGDTRLALWDLAGGTRKTVPVGMNGRVLALSPDGRTLVVGGYDGGVRFYDPVTGQSRGTFRRHLYPIQCLAFSADGTSLVTGSSGGGRGGDLLSWRLERPPQHRLSLESPEPVQRLALSPEGKRVLAVTPFGHLREWDLTSQEQIDEAEPPPVPPRGLGQGLPSSFPIDLGFSADGRLWQTVHQLATAPNQPPRLVTTHSDGKRDEVALPPFATLFTRAARRPVALAAINPEDHAHEQIPFLDALDLDSGKSTRLFEAEEGTDFVVGPAGRHVLTRNVRKNQQRILDARTGKILWECGRGFSLLDQPEVVFAPGERFVMVRLQGKIRLHDPATGKQLFEVAASVPSPTRPSLPVFSPTARWLVLWGNQQTPSRLFEAASGLEKPALPAAVLAARAAFTPEEKHLLLVVFTPQPTLLVWDVEAGKVLRQIALGDPQVGELLPLNGTTTVLVLSAQGPARLFDWQAGKLVRAVNLSMPGEAVTRGTFHLVTGDGKTLIRGGPFRCQLWDTATWKLRSAPVTEGPFTHALSEDRGTLVLIQGTSLRVLDTATGKERAAHDLPSPIPWRFLQVCADGKTCLGSGTRRPEPTREIQVRDGTAAAPRASFRSYTGRVLALALNGDASRAFSAGEDRLIHVWDPATGKEEEILAGHREPVQLLALSPDEAFLASVGSDGLRLWDLRAMKERAVLAGHVDAITTLTFSLDGKLLATGGEDLLVRLWEVPAGKLRATLQGHRDTIHHAVFSRDGSQIVTCSADRTIKVWDVPPPASKGTQPPSLPPLSGPEAERLAASCTAVTPDGQALLRGLPSGRLERVDLKTGRRELLEGAHTGPVTALALGPDGKLVATGDAVGTVLLHRLESGRKEAEWADHSLPVRALAFSPDGTLLVSGEGAERNLFAPFRPGRLLVRETAGGKIRHTLWPHQGGIHALCFTKAGELVVGSDDASVSLWDVAEAKVRLRIPLGGQVRALVPHPDGSSLFTISDSSQSTLAALIGPVRRWDLGSGRELAGTGLPWARGLAFSADGKVLLLEQGGTTIPLWDLQAGRFRVLLGTRARTQRLALLGDGKTLVAATADGGVESWDLSAQMDRPLAEKLVAGDVLAAVQTEGGKSLVGLTLEQGKASLHVWERATLRDRRLINLGALSRAGMDAATLATQLLFAATEDGRRAALYGPGPGPIRLWDLETGKEHKLGDPRVPIRALAFSPDGRRLAAAGDDGVVRVWDSASGQLHAELKGHGRQVLSLAFTPDGLFLASADAAARVHFWEVASGRSAQPGGLDLAEGKPADGGAHLAFSPVHEPDYLLATSGLGNVGGTALWPLKRDKDSGTVSPGPRRVLAGAHAGKVAFVDGGRGLLIEYGGFWLHDVESGRLLASFGIQAERYLAGRSLLRLQSVQVIESWEPRLETRTLGEMKPTSFRFGGRLHSAPNGLLSPDRDTLTARGAELDRLLRVPTAPFVAMPSPSGTDRPPLVPLTTEAGFAVVRLAKGADGSLAAAAKDGRVSVWSADGKVRFTTEAGPALTALAFAPDDQWLVLADTTSRLRILSAADGKLLKEWKTTSAATAVALSRSRQTVATGDARGEVVLWKRADGTALRRWTAHDRAVGQLVFGAKDEKIASFGAESKAYLWSTETGKQLAWFGPGVPILRLAYSPDGRQLAILSQAGLHVWDTTPVKLQLFLHSPLLLDMAWGPDGKTVTLASAVRILTQRTQLTAFDLGVVGRSRLAAPPAEEKGSR